jgi:hypothetical protein
VEIEQSRNSNRIRYEFGEDAVQYTWQDSSGSRSFSLPYTDISRDRQTLEERNQWLRNVALLWIAIGIAGTAFTWFGDQVFRLSFWGPVGVACYAVYWFRRTRFTILPSEKGNLLVIDDAQGPRIIEQIEIRRAAQLRREYDFVDANEDAAHQSRRFRWLHREGALSDEELRERLATVEADGLEAMPADVPAGRLLLN